jgi:hypothetical protein
MKQIKNLMTECANKVRNFMTEFMKKGEMEEKSKKFKTQGHLPDSNSVSIDTEKDSQSPSGVPVDRKLASEIL